MRPSFEALPDIALFVEIAGAGSFGRAAARLEIPRATLSRRIAAMETRLGVKLFQRTTRSVTLTGVAKPYLTECRRILDAAERAQSVLQRSLEQQGRIRISMPVDLGVDILGPIVAAYAAERPGLEIDLDLSARAADLHRDPVDLVFRVGRPLDERVVARKVGDIASGVYAAPSLLRRLSPIASPDQLAHAPCLDLRTAKGSMPWRIGSHRWDGAPGPHRLAANSVELLRTLAERGYGLALLPVHIASRGVETKRLARILPDEPIPTWPLYAITANRVVPGQVRLLIAQVKRALHGAPI